MKKRLVPVLALFVLSTIAGVVFAEKKTMPTVTVMREGSFQQLTLNPTSIMTTRSNSWRSSECPSDNGDAPPLEFVAGDPISMELELEFDAFESKEDVYAKFIASLESLTVVDQKMQRPPQVRFVWGTNFPTFDGVIEEMSTKYTMFLSNGTPVRATVNLKMKQASKLVNKKEAENCKKTGN